MLSSAAQKNMDDTETILGPLAVPGDHMKTNVLNAALVLRLMKIAPEKIIRILGNWEGLPHRLQYFFSWTPDQQKNAGIKTRLRSVKFYNDSCATVPEAAAAASQAFGHPVILLCGGTEKGLSMAPLAASLSCHHHEMPVKSLYLLAGSATDELCTLLRKYKVSYNGPYPSLEDMLTAVKRKLSETASSSLLQTDETIVFSPGATSFGMFINEFDRGTKFMETVRQLFGTA
jgi:UDP-N-acetylmuramoylalanine--D-glutamate ligase